MTHSLGTPRGRRASTVWSENISLAAPPARLGTEARGGDVSVSLHHCPPWPGPAIGISLQCIGDVGLYQLAVGESLLRLLVLGERNSGG